MSRAPGNLVERAPQTEMPSPRPPLPTFVIIGAQKSATRWLRANLGQHPDVYTAPAELHFWNVARRVENPTGLSWYRNKFAGWDGEPIVGEATPGYMIWRHGPAQVATRMKAKLPDAQLIAILRNPIDRANSAMIHHIRRRRLPPTSRLTDLAHERRPHGKDRLCLMSGSWYALSLRGYQQEWGDNLLVLLHDDVVANPAQVYERALRHVGAEPGFVPPSLSKVMYSNRRAGARSAYELSYAERCEIYEYFRRDVGQLEDMFGLDLSHWEPKEAETPDAIAPVRRLSWLRPRGRSARYEEPPASSAGS